jgi:carbon monoxide dehydrogenase subunit G
MPEHTYETTMAVPVPKIWDFVQDMDNWAPFVTGYQGHERVSDANSIWTLKGDMGVLSRTVKLDVNITQWDEQERVEFTLTGINEQVSGDGTFLMSPIESDTPPAPEVKAGAWTRFMTWLARLFGQAPKREALPAPGDAGARMSFRLRMDAGGPMAPMLNAMLAPALGPATQTLGEKIAAQLEQTEA